MRSKMYLWNIEKYFYSNELFTTKITGVKKEENKLQREVREHRCLLPSLLYISSASRPIISDGFSSTEVPKRSCLFGSHSWNLPILTAQLWKVLAQLGNQKYTLLFFLQKHIDTRVCLLFHCFINRTSYEFPNSFTVAIFHHKCKRLSNREVYM